MLKMNVKRCFWLVLIIILIFFPQIFGIYYVNAFVTFTILAVFSASLNILLGYTGLLSFGHAIYFAAGGYGTALALTHINEIALLPAIGVGLVSAALLALVLSPLVVRLGGTAFAMLHLAFAQLMYTLALKLRWITGGEDGIANFPVPDLVIPGLIRIPMKNDPMNFYYLAIIIFGASLWLIWFFTKTPFGQIQAGIRENEKRIEYLGFMVPEGKAVVYVISAVIAGLAGSLGALFQNMVSVDSYLGPMVSFAPIVNIVIGGVGNFFGPILGTAIFQIVEDVVSRYTDRMELVTGLISVFMIMYAPLGVIGLIDTIKQQAIGKWRRRTLSGK